MKILELRTENIKNLKVVEIRPEGPAVILTGKNGAGKSAVLDSIFLALTGEKLEQPIREGEARAEINVDLGKYKVKRIFTAKGERLEVTSAEGAVFKSPQALLDGILGKLTFDPLAFATMDDRSRRDLLAKLVGLDFAALNAQRLALYNERTIKNREIKGGDPTAFRKDAGAPLPLESLVQQLEKPAPETPRLEISMAEELAKIETLEEKAKIYRKYEYEVMDILEFKVKCEADIYAKKKEIGDLQERIKLLDGDIELLTENAKKAEASAKDLPAPEKISEEQIANVRANLREVEQKNIAIRAAVKFDQALERLEGARAAVNKFEEQMIRIDLEKQEKVNAAHFPIAGLGITDEFVTFEDKPFSQLSTGRQIMISTAIAMAMNPEVRVIFIREGSLLDKEGLEGVVQLAKEKDYQVWIEKVMDAKGVGIYLEAGEIAKEK